MEAWNFVTSCSRMKEKNKQEFNVSGDHEQGGPLATGKYLVMEDLNFSWVWELCLY